MKKLSKIVSIVIVVALFLQINVFAAGSQITITSIVEDPVEQVIMINGSLSSGPEHMLSLAVLNQEGEIVYPDSMRTINDGIFGFVVGVSNFEEGSYRYQIKSDDGAVYEDEFTIPFQGSVNPIQGTLSNDSILMMDENQVNNTRNTFDIQLTNARIRTGAISSSNYVINGLPEGLNATLVATSENVISVTITGNAAAPIEAEQQFTIQLKSSILVSGAANTSSAELGPISIIPAQIATKVTLADEPVSKTIYMKNKYQPDVSNNSFIVEVLYLDIDTNNIWNEYWEEIDQEGKLIVHPGQFSYELPAEMEGMEITAVANQKTNTVKFTLEGIAKNPLTSDQTIDIVIKGAYYDPGAENPDEDQNKAVLGAEIDSEPITLTVVASNSDVEGGSTVTPGTGGSVGTGSGTGTPVTPPSITDPDENPGDIDPIVPEQPEGFEDVKGHWAESYINYLFQRGIVKGVSDTAFEPDRNVTRAEFVTMIVRALDLPIQTYNNSFSDVAASDWYANNIETALQNNLITIYDTFRPNDLITREEMTKMTVAAWQTKNSTPDNVTKATYFSDYNDISDWAEEYVDLSVAVGLIQGNDQNQFLPLDNATRAESATIITRLLTNY